MERDVLGLLCRHVICQHGILENEFARGPVGGVGTTLPVRVVRRVKSCKELLRDPAYLFLAGCFFIETSLIHRDKKNSIYFLIMLIARPGCQKVCG